MSKFGLISDLDADVRSPKTQYQLFEAEMGFEKADVLIPLEKAELFEQKVLKLKPKSKASLARIAKEFGGQVK